MRRAVSYLPLALLFLASAVPSNGQNTETTTAPEPEVTTGEEFLGEELYYEVRGNFQLNCTLGGKISWKKNGTDILEYPALSGHVVMKPYKGVENAQLTLVGRATENDFGNYTCVNGDGEEKNWKVKARPYAKLPPDSNVVEGQKLKLTCKIFGRPYPQVYWTYNNVSLEENITMDVVEALGESRVKLSTSEQGVPDGDLVIEKAERSDAGYYRCTPADPHGKNSTTTLRVKDMYAALWPFLGICAEVFILCTIILVYEKRRTKPELDDSDTDNHDQKKS